MRRDIRHTIIAAITACTLFSTGGANALVVTGDPADYVTTDYSGVGKLLINSSLGNFGCSGSLIGGGAYVLTAAHCVTDGKGALVSGISSTISFETSTASFTSSITSYYVHDGWKGNVLRGDDIAILELANTVTGFDSYDLYTESDELGQIWDKVGYGLAGEGNTGSGSSDFGTKRTGQNRYDMTGKDAPKSWRMDDSQLLFDFDNGLVAQDGMGYYFGVVDLGLDITKEVMSAPGDSGGPTFIGDMIAGITSFGFRLSGTDIDTDLNSSYGEFGGDTRVSSFTDWINAVLTGTPIDGGGGGGGGGGNNKGGKGPKAGTFAVALPVPAPPAFAILAISVAGLFIRRRLGSRSS
jgi:secreted trypsin-like serine protease